MGSLIFILPILVIAGAFMWLRPSKRDQALARLRSDALVRGFRIGSMKVPDLSEYGRTQQKKEIVTIYQKRLLALPHDDGPGFTVLRTTGESGAYLPDGWAWHQRHLMTDSLYDVLASQLVKFPESVTLVSLSSDSIALSWDERDPQVSFEKLDAWLQELATAFQRQGLG